MRFSRKIAENYKISENLIKVQQIIPPTEAGDYSSAQHLPRCRRAAGAGIYWSWDGIPPPRRSFSTSLHL